MCAIFGFYRDPKAPRLTPMQTTDLAVTMSRLVAQCAQRGRDGTGWLLAANYVYDHTPVAALKTDRGFNQSIMAMRLYNEVNRAHQVDSIIGNCRAEPTTEWQPDKDEQRLQPYSQNISNRSLYAVHNGIIANDREFLTDWPANTIDSQAIPVAASQGRFDELTGSQATAMYLSAGAITPMQINQAFTLEPGQLLLHRNYRPLAVLYVPHFGGWIFASKQEFITASLPKQVPYLIVDMPANHTLALPTMQRRVNLPEGRAAGDHAIVILSGGLDSSTVAELALRTHQKVTLIHFHYGCRAQTKETEAVTAIAARLKHEHKDCQVLLEFIDMSFLKDLGGSTLTDPTAVIATGEAGAEFAHEWVPFRNGLMLSSIVAYCDRHQCSHIYLGANLEEAGAYGDNEQEFYELMTKAVAIGSKSAPTIVNPLENLMKHEIAKLAVDIGAPADLSWSCYHGGDLHCGDCGPCYMRQKAFRMNGLVDPVTYATE